MMPGENQSHAGEVASEATSGTCQNCTILSRSLDEYMSALLALKQKIIDTDHLLSEYKEKCDELQKSQRESSKLHKQLDDVLLQLGPLEKQTADYETVKAELADMKTAVKSYQQKLEEVDSLRAENAKELALKQKLEDSLKKAEDTAETQSLENMKLRSEKKSLEEDLQKTRDSLRTCQQAAEELERLRLQNAKTLILKSNLENQLLALQDTNLQQNNDIGDLKCENSRLAEVLVKTQEKLQKLEKEFNKEKTNISIQTETEPEVDKAKVRMLLEQLWKCVDPLSQTTETVHLTDLPDSQNWTTPSKHGFQSAPLQPSGSLIRQYMSQSAVSSPAKGTNSQTPGPSSPKLEASPRKSKPPSFFHEQSSPKREQENRRPGSKKKQSLESHGPNESSTQIHDTAEWTTELDDDAETVRESWGNGTNLWEILDIFKPLPAALSPTPSLSHKLAETDDVPTRLDPKEGSMSSDKTTVESTKSKPLQDAVAVQSSFSDSSLKTGHLCSEMPLVPLYTDNVVLDNFVSECQDMEVEGLCKREEASGNSAIRAQSLQNGCESDFVQINPARIIPTETQPSTMEDHGDVISQSQCNVGSELASTLCNEVINKSSDSGHRLINTDHKCQDTGDGLENQNSLAPQEIQGSFIPDQMESSSTPDDISISIDSKMNASSCTMVDGVSSLGSSKDDESSVEQELFCLEKKDSGIGLRPSMPNSSHHLNGVGTNDPDPVEKQASVSQVQRMSPETKTEGVVDVSSNTLDPESKRNYVILEDKRITENIYHPAIPKKNTATDSQHVTGAHDHLQEEEEEEKLSEALGSNVASMDRSLVTSLKEPLTKAEDQITVSSQDALQPCSDAAGKPLTYPCLDEGMNLSPSTASRDAVNSTPSPDPIGRVRTEMGPPLPPVVMPLTATPPKFVKHHNLGPNMQLPSSLPGEGPCSLMQQPAETSPNSSFEDETKMSPCLTTPSPSSLGVPTFPLQFGSETPKHAVPVPGRLPSSALTSSSPTVPQESSMQLLDTMYPELSAQARTLTILRGNVSLGRAAGEGCPPPAVIQISGNKTINSSSTAFTKTEQKVKRMGANVLFPKSAKRLRLDTCSPAPANITSPLQQYTDAHPSSDPNPPESQPATNWEPGTECISEVKRTEKQSQIADAIEKIQTSCFDVLPVIKSHVFLGRISKVPVLRDEEKSVLADFWSNQSSAEELMLAILSKMKLERASTKVDHLHALCRVYVGLCRQRREHQKVHALAYHLLKEDFPDAAKMILFAVTTWPTVLSHESPLCKAIHAVSKTKAEGEILDYLTAYLHWDEAPSGDLSKMVSSTLKALIEDGELQFQKHDRYGDDLCPRAWEYIFTVDLLCARLGWKWTLENIIGKELWPVMNAWVTQPRHKQTPVRDVCVAAVLRLIGRLGQLAIKEKRCGFVQNVLKPINLFAKHGRAEGVPWEVQLSAVYAIYDLAPISPKDALDALASWRGETTQPVPPAVTSYITQIGSLCRQIKPRNV